ncbi:MAG: tyrosine-type recombinase/integrase [Rickettsiales bacterium]|jgi:integrase|nr:tyrosine-type recombinase/integrase [Rickettsiales bacterium]
MKDLINSIGNKKVKGNLTFNELAIQFLQAKIRQGLKNKTINKYQDYIRILKAYFGLKYLRDIDKTTIKQYEDYRTLNGDRQEYIREQLQTLSIMMNYAVEFEHLNTSPFDTYHFKKHLPHYKPRIRFLTPDECTKLIENCSDTLRPLVIFLLETGCRIGEALNILFTDLCIDENTRLPYLVIRKEISKSNKQRIIPLSKLALEQINYQHRTNPNSVVIFTHGGTPYSTYPKRALTTAMKKAGLKEEGGLFHLLRHTAGSLWIQGLNIDGTKREPVRIELISEILGHSNINITKNVYAMFDKGDVIRAFIINEKKEENEF